MSIITRRPTEAEINLSNLEFNFRSVKRFVGSGVRFMAVVKADAYGHGAARCSQLLQDCGVDWFGVAIPEEGIALREHGITQPILCLGGFWPGQESSLIEHTLTPVVFDLEQAGLFDEASRRGDVNSSYHVKIDTGMGRIGVPFEKIEAFSKELRKFSHLRLEGLMTHFASADDLSENDFTNKQIERFEASVEVFAADGHRPTIFDLANSPGAIAHSDSRKNLVRIGGVLYGLGEDVLPQTIDLPELMPVMSLHSKIAQIKTVPAGRTLGYGRTFKTERDSLIATVPIGYQDGYMRAFSNKARAAVRGKLAPVAGRISMDWTLLDVTDIESASVGDRVTLIGIDGGVRVTAADLALLADTISYEVTCGLDKRVSRVYVDGK